MTLYFVLDVYPVTITIRSVDGILAPVIDKGFGSAKQPVKDTCASLLEKMVLIGSGEMVIEVG